MKKFKSKKAVTIVIVMIFLLIVTIITTSIISISSRYSSNILKRSDSLRETITYNDTHYND